MQTWYGYTPGNHWSHRAHDLPGSLSTMERYYTCVVFDCTGISLTVYMETTRHLDFTRAYGPDSRGYISWLAWMRRSYAS